MIEKKIEKFIKYDDNKNGDEIKENIGEILNDR